MDAERWKQVRASFDELVELDASERTSRLAVIGAADPELRRSVESLLAADAAADARLGRIESPFLRRAPSSTSEPDPFGLAGRTVSHFRVLQRIETGGMGVVYRAEDVRLSRPVALKFLLPQYQLEPSAKARFLEEARAVAALDHPNLCAIYESGESEDGRLFLAMPLYEGETLKARLERSGPLPLEEALGIARGVAQGLACAHAAGVVHRDLKPANLLLTSGGGVKVLDFGVARVKDRRLTAPGLVVGTVGYMAPEQLRNEAVDARTDLWALGVVLYEMLTGRHPFDGDHDVSVARAVLHEEPVPPGALRGDLPPGVEALVATLLRKDPADRFGSAEELLAEIAPPSSTAVHAPPRSRSPRRRWPLRRSSVVAVVALATLAALGVAARLLRVGPPAGAPVERSIAVLPFNYRSAEQDHAYFADGVTDEILLALANVGDLRVISRTSVMQYRGTHKTIRQIADELGVAYVLEGSVRRAEDRVRISAELIDARADQHLWAKSFDRPMQDIFAVQSEIAQRIAQALQAKLTTAERTRLDRHPTTNLAAHDYVLRGSELVRRNTPGDTETALRLLRRARELDPGYPDAFAALSGAFRIHYRFTGDHIWLDSAVVAARRAVTLDPEFARGHSDLGWALDWGGDREAALEAHLRAVQLNPNLSDGLANLYHYGFGRLDEAARWWGPALETDPTNTVLSWLAGRTYLHLGMPARARALIQKTTEFQPDFLWPHYSLSTAYLLEGRPREARAQIRRMLAAGRDDPAALMYAGHVEAALGDLPQARAYYERGMAAPQGYATGAGELSLAWILQRSGEAERARGLVRGAARQLEKAWGGRPRRPEDFAELARIRVLEGDREDAIRQMEKAVRLGWRFPNDLPGDLVLGSLRGDPRFDRLMAEVKADVDRQRARVEREGW